MAIRAKLRDFLQKKILIRRDMRRMTADTDSLLLHGRVNKGASLSQTLIQFRMAGKTKLVDSLGEVTFLSGPMGVMARDTESLFQRLVDHGSFFNLFGDLRMA